MTPWQSNPRGLEAWRPPDPIRLAGQRSDEIKDMASLLSGLAAAAWVGATILGALFGGNRR